MWIGWFFICWLAYLWLEACRDKEEDYHTHNTSSCDDGALDIDDIDPYDVTNFNIDPIAAQQYSMIYDQYDPYDK